MNFGRDINPIFLCTTKIGQDEDSGTGFFLNFENNTYVVTNRHVVDPEDKSIDSIRVWFREYHDVSSTVHTDLDLSGGIGTDWYGHPTSEVDIALIPVNRLLSNMDESEEGINTTGSLAFTPDWFPHHEVPMMSDVSIICYPGDFLDTRGRYPIRRKALISSPYGTPFDGKPYFLTDARMHPGTSGSPVLMMDTHPWVRKGDIPDHRNKPAYILGVHSADIPSDKYAGEASENQDSVDNSYRVGRKELDLNIAWYTETIMDILFQIFVDDVLTDDELDELWEDLDGDYMGLIDITSIRYDEKHPLRKIRDELGYPKEIK